jgi:hypothetical protein
MTDKKRDKLQKSFFDLVNKILLKVTIPKQMATLIMIINTIQNFPFLFDLLKGGALGKHFSKIVIDSVKMLRPVELISKLGLGKLIIWILVGMNTFLMLYLGFFAFFFRRYHKARLSKSLNSTDVDRMLESNLIKVFYTTMMFFNLCLVNPISEVLM